MLVQGLTRPATVLDVPDPDKPETWVFQLMTSWKEADGGEGTTSLQAQKKRAETFGEPFRSANLWIPDDTALFENKMSYWAPAEFQSHGGRAALLGDAAHPMTFRKRRRPSTSPVVWCRVPTYRALTIAQTAAKGSATGSSTLSSLRRSLRRLLGADGVWRTQSPRTKPRSLSVPARRSSCRSGTRRCCTTGRK